MSMVSFQVLWENMASNEQEEKPMAAIRTGINIRDDFWDDFLLLINNSEALSELLDVPTTTISGWHSKVHEMLSKVKKSDENPEPGKKSKMVHTGSESMPTLEEM